MDLRRGDLVQVWFDTGAMGAKILYGVVTQAGPKRIDVCWESGLSNRIHRDAHGIGRAHDVAAAREAVKHGVLALAEAEAARALGNANAARTERSRARWLRSAQRWLDRANDLRGWGELTTPAGSRCDARAKRERGA